MHGLQRGTFLADVEGLEESPAQLLGQDHAAEGGLAVALRGDEHGHDGVAVFLLGQHPLCHH